MVSELLITLMTVKQVTYLTVMILSRKRERESRKRRSRNQLLMMKFSKINMIVMTITESCRRDLALDLMMMMTIKVALM